MEMENFSFKQLKNFDEELEKFEKHLREYLLQNDIERSSEIDSEIFDIYDEVRELRTFINVAIDELDEREELDQGLKERIWEKLNSLGLLEKAGAAATIWDLINKILKLIGK